MSDIDEYLKYLKVGDTGEPIRAQIVNNDDGLAQDLTGAAVQFLMFGIDSDTGELDELVNAVGSVEVPETDGRIRYNWQSGDTDTEGAHLAYFLITYSDGNEERFPRKNYMTMHIESNLL